MKLLTITCLIFVFTVAAFAQNKYYLTPDGNVRTETELKKIISKAYSKEKNIKSGSEKLNILWPDTLRYRYLFSGPNASYEIYSRQIAVQWFVSPIPLKITKFAICPYSNPDNAHAEMKIVKLNWTNSQLDTAGIRNWGYYPAENNGFNNITGFLDNPDRTGEWVDISGSNVPPPFAEDIFSDGGLGAPIIPNNPTVFLKEYQWVEIFSGWDIIVEAGEVFGVVMTNINVDYTDSVNHRVGLFSGDANLPPAFKFYPNGRYQSSTGADKGWWTIDKTFDIAVEVEFIWIDELYEITNITNIHSTISTDPQTIYADIDDGNPPGVPSVPNLQNVNLVYRLNNDPALFTIPMTRENEIKWKGDIPGQSPGTTVTYYIEIRDTNGNFIQRTLEEYKYAIFQPNPQNKTLLVFNGFDFETDGYPQEYYFGTGDFVNQTTYNFNHDVWAFGTLTEEIVNNYLNIIEISNSNGGPAEYNDDVIRTWLTTNAAHNYMLSGQEWLGARHGFTNMDFAAGTFEFDILGITHSYNDVSYANSTGWNLTSLMFPVDGSLLTDSLHGAFTQSAADSLLYDPIRESPEIPTGNWIDAYDVASDVIIDMFVETRGIENVSVIDTLPTLSHRTLPTGNKIAFFGYDPLYVNSSAPYVWWGFHNYAPQVQVLHWFDVINSIEDEKPTIIPENFSLEQNYPNPFNPSTIIRWSIATASNTTIKIYDVLGREIKTLINQEMNPGEHEITFDGKNLSSGVYYAVLRTGNNSKSIKMVLMK